jgi:hypothetical protein
MDPLRWPLISYFFDWDNVSGTYMFGLLGMVVFVATCVACWKQAGSDLD